MSLPPVVLLNTSERGGGAAIACHNLFQGLRRIGVPASLLVEDAQPGGPGEGVAAVGGQPSPVASLFLRVMQDNYLGARRTADHLTYFSTNLAGRDPIDHPLLREAGIVHLHWVANLLSNSGIARLLAGPKPVVWTLHDQGPLTGGCHYSSGCRQFETSCRTCPQLREDPLSLVNATFEEKARLWDTARLTVVSPSRWLADEARRSRLFRRARVEVIPYGLDVETFSVRPRLQARQALGLPADAVVLLFVCTNVAERRKGFREFQEALALAARDEAVRARLAAGKIVSLQIGKDGIAASGPIPVMQAGHVDDPARLSLLYNAADAFLIPSLEDNLPNTMLEALACGTPVIGFATGGIPDMVVPGETGALAPIGDVAALAARIADLCRDPEAFARLRRACRRKAEQELDLKVQAARYRDLYADLLSGPGMKA